MMGVRSPAPLTARSAGVGVPFETVLSGDLHIQAAAQTYTLRSDPTLPIPAFGTEIGDPQFLACRQSRVTSRRSAHGSEPVTDRDACDFHLLSDFDAGLSLGVQPSCFTLENAVRITRKLLARAFTHLRCHVGRTAVLR